MTVNYHAYIASREWGLKKRAVRERSGGVCERCKKNPHEVTHHLTYERLGAEPLDDLAGLCRPCHDYVGGYSDEDPAPERWECRITVPPSYPTPIAYIAYVARSMECLWHTTGASAEDIARMVGAKQPSSDTRMVEVVVQCAGELVKVGPVEMRQLERIEQPPPITSTVTARRPEWDYSNSLRRDQPARNGGREMFPATCPDCGDDCEVPFRPSNGYARCWDCYRQQDED